MTNFISIAKARASLRSWSHDWGSFLTVCSGLFVIFYFFWIFLVQPAEEYKKIVTDIAQPVISLFMTMLAWRASRHPALDIRQRRAWKVLTLAFLMYCLGNAIWGYLEVFAGLTLAVSLADVPYLAYYPICLIGLLLFPLDRAGRSRLTFALDAGTVMLGATIVIWYLILRPVALAQYPNVLETVVTVAYPVANTVLLFGVITVLLRRPSGKSETALRILMAAIFCDAIADFGYSYQTLENSYFGGQWPDCLYLLAYVLMTFGAHYQYRNAEIVDYKKQDEASRTPPSSWLPYAAVAGTYTLILYVTYKREPTIGSASIIWLTIGAFLLTVLVAVRQMLALRENSKLLAEKASRESEMRLAALIQHSSDVITVIGRDGAVRYMSPSTERMFGFRAQRFLGSQLGEYIHPHDEQQLLDSLALIAEQPQRTVSLELRARHRDGRWIHLESVITNLLGEPSIAGIVINSRDVTERKKAERALHDGREKLRQAQKLESLGQIATSVGHDFTNLVEVIIGYAQLLMRRHRPEGNEDTIHWLKEIQDAGRRAKTLTNQLLAFSVYLPRGENSDALFGFESDPDRVDDRSEAVPVQDDIEFLKPVSNGRD